MIPQYRGKEIDSDEWAEGAFDGVDCILTSDMKTVTSKVDGSYKCYRYKRIDQKTLAIHFPSMIDKNGKKIFASLSEDGIGGDEVVATATSNDHNQRGAIDTLIAKMFMGNCCLGYKDTISGVPIYPFNVSHTIEIIGIHNG